MRFSKQSFIDGLYAHAEHLEVNHDLDPRIGYRQLSEGADTNSQEWWERVQAYLESQFSRKLAEAIEVGRFPPA